jgi:hypothetical protein
MASNEGQQIVATVRTRDEREGLWPCPANLARARRRRHHEYGEGLGWSFYWACQLLGTPLPESDRWSKLKCPIKFSPGMGHVTCRRQAV